MASKEVAEPGSSSRQLTLRLRCESKPNQILKNVSEDQSLRHFFEQISELTGVPGQYMVLLAGYPPKKLSYSPSATVKTLGLSLQDTLNVQKGTDQNWMQDDVKIIPPKASVNGDADIEEVAVVFAPGASNSFGSGQKKRKNSAGNDVDDLDDPTRRAAASSDKNSSKLENISKQSAPVVMNQAEDEEVVFWEEHEASSYATRGFMLRHSVPNDNSCLFWAVLHVLGNRDSGVGSPTELRKIIASTVAKNPDHYTQVFLGRTNEDYQKWICNEQSWGGAIEVAILSEHFGVEFAVVNIQAKSICVFGEDKNYATRVYLIYDGIHYDALHLESFYGHAPVTEFRREDQTVYEMALEIGVEACNSHQYTDINNFTLRCSQCNEVIVGDDGARKHTMATRHVQFEEMKPPF